MPDAVFFIVVGCLSGTPLILEGGEVEEEKCCDGTIRSGMVLNVGQTSSDCPCVPIWMVRRMVSTGQNTWKLLHSMT